MSVIIMIDALIKRMPSSRLFACGNFGKEFIS